MEGGEGANGGAHTSVPGARVRGTRKAAAHLPQTHRQEGGACFVSRRDTGMSKAQGPDGRVFHWAKVRQLEHQKKNDDDDDDDK